MILPLIFALHFAPVAPAAPGERLLSPEDMYALEFDFDKNGQLSPMELRSVAASAEAYPSNKKRFMDSTLVFDLDHDGKLNNQERQAFYKDRNDCLDARDAERLKKYDSDHDGKLSDREYAALVADLNATALQLKLKQYDLNKDGQVTPEEESQVDAASKAESAARQARSDAADKELAASMERFRQVKAAKALQLDGNGDGKVNPEEQLAYDKAQAFIKEDRDARNIKKFDKDGDGKLNEEEQAACDKSMNDIRERLAARKAATQKAFDKDGDGKLNEEEQAAYDKARNEIRERLKDTQSK
ncbi:MAG: hypothetical protein RL095_3045 [Verrucomicrobiota bacterium]|jgi:Ca2+-binding EF-hand superfamily protein